MSYDSHQHTHTSMDNIYYRIYKSFKTNEEVPLKNILSFDKEHIWKELSLERALDLIQNKEENDLSEDQLKSLLIYSVIKYSIENIPDIEMMYLAELINYEIKDYKTLSDNSDRKLRESHSNNEYDNILLKLLELSSVPERSSDYRLGVIDSIKTVVSHGNT